MHTVHLCIGLCCCSCSNTLTGCSLHLDNLCRRYTCHWSRFLCRYSRAGRWAPSSPPHCSLHCRSISHQHRSRCPGSGWDMCAHCSPPRCSPHHSSRFHSHSARGHCSVWDRSAPSSQHQSRDRHTHSSHHCTGRGLDSCSGTLSRSSFPPRNHQSRRRRCQHIGHELHSPQGRPPTSSSLQRSLWSTDTFRPHRGLGPGSYWDTQARCSWFPSILAHIHSHRCQYCSFHGRCSKAWLQHHLSLKAEGESPFNIEKCEGNTNSKFEVTLKTVSLWYLMKLCLHNWAWPFGKITRVICCLVSS